MGRVGGRRTNQALLVLTAGAVGTGLAMFAVGSGWNRWATLAHGAIAVALVALVPWKSAIARRGLRRRGPWSAAPSLALAVAVLTALVTGLAHRTGGRELGPLLVMQVHVAAAVAAAALTTWHVATRPVPLPVRSTDLGRRTALRGGLLAGGAAAVTVALPHASDRYTRSLERGSFDPQRMPVTQWFLDEVAVVPVPPWRLQVGVRTWDLAQLVELGTEERTATLDCTGGWYATQRWRGVPLDRLLDASGTPAHGRRSIEVRSTTGYRRRFPAADAGVLLLATLVGGAPLSPGHGYPARLVAPGRRGFWWVKWVDRIDVDDRPWWWQPPLPLR